MARYGKPFRKKSNKGKHRKGTWIRYKYENGRRVGAVKSRYSHSSKRGGNYRRRYRRY